MESAPVSLQSHCRASYSNLTPNCHAASLAALFILLQEDVNKTNEWINTQIMRLGNVNNVWNGGCFLTVALHSGFFHNFGDRLVYSFPSMQFSASFRGDVWPALSVYGTSRWWGKVVWHISLHSSSMKNSPNATKTEPVCLHPKPLLWWSALISWNPGLLFTPSHVPPAATRLIPATV